MGAGSLIRPVLQALRSAPGYSRVRRGTIIRLRGSTTARRVARSSFPDLRDHKQVKAAVSEAVAAEQQAHAAQLQRLRGELTAERNTEVARVRREMTAELRAQRAEHREKLRRTKADIVRKEDRKRRAKPAVSAGDLVAGLYLGDRPLLVFDVRGVELPVAESMVEEIAREQVLGCAFRPMFLSDLPDPTIWRRYGHLCEVVPPEQGWPGIIPYAEYLAQRLESIRADFDARWCVAVSPDGLTETQRAFLRRCGR